MIQRKQTLFLLFSVILLVGYLFSPILRVDSGNVHNYIKGRELALNVNFPIIGHYFVFMCLTSAMITAGLNLLTIFLFKYRRVQTFLCWLSIIPAIFTLCYPYYRMTNTDIMQDQLFYYGNITPLIAIIFIFLAMFYIRKDEELVKSADRLR